MDLVITNQREIKPYKTAVKQYEAGTTSLVFTREGYMYDQVDLRRYTAYAETEINGSVDMTELTYEIVDGNVVITWVIGEQTLRHAGTISYQIVFKEKPADGGFPLDGSGSGVFRTYQAILQNSESIDADGAIAADYPTILKQHLDLINALAGSFDSAVFEMQPDNVIPLEQRLEGRLYYQIEDAKTKAGHFENHLGKRLEMFETEQYSSSSIKLSDLKLNGIYRIGGNPSDSPVSDDVRCWDVLVLRVPNAPEYIQFATCQISGGVGKTFYRGCSVSYGPGTWNELAPKKLGTKGQMVVITDVNGNLAENAVIGTEELYGLEGFKLAKGTFQQQLNSKTKQSDFEAHIQANNAAIDTINDTLEAVQIASDIIELSMVQHAQNANIHVSAADREKWNSPQFPVGSLLNSVRSSMEGWLLCDGSTYNKSTYPELATALGATGSTFTVPDFRGKTMWGASDAQPVGSVVEAGLPNIVATVNSGFDTESKRGGAFRRASGAMSVRTATVNGIAIGTNIGETYEQLDFDASNSNDTYGKSDTVQPPAIAVNVFIKY